MSATTGILGDVTNRVNEFSKHFSFDVNNIKSEVDIEIRKVDLKRKRLQALASLARSRALLAEAELLIAENELYSEFCNLKRRKPNPGYESKGFNVKPSKQENKNNSSKKGASNPKSKPSKASDNTQRRSECKPKTTSEHKKTQHLRENKENVKILPQKRKDIVLDEPPFKSDASSQPGYVTPYPITRNRNFGVQHPTFRTSNEIHNMFPNFYRGIPTHKILTKDNELNPKHNLKKEIDNFTQTETKSVNEMYDSKVNCTITNGLFGEIMQNKLTITIEDDNDSVERLLIDLDA